MKAHSTLSEQNARIKRWVLWAVIFVAFGLSQGCLVGGSGAAGNDADTSPSPTPTPTATPEANLSHCSTTLVDAGQKGNSAAVARGAYSDTKMIPGSASPSTAFADPSAVSLKFSYWNGSQFVTEIVSGDGGGAFVRLAYTSGGIPMVFWTLGVNLKVAIRSQPIGTPGVWNAGIIDTGVAPRAVEVSINPLNQVMVSFLTDTATTGHPKFLYCGAPCLSPSGFETMTPSGYIESTAIVAAQTATGAAWCKASANTYYPAVTYSVTGAVHYAVCQNSPGNCLNSANWATTSVVAAGSVSSKLDINSAIAGDTPRIVSAGTSGIIPYKMGTTPCSSAPTAFTAGTAMGSATSGSLWMAFLQDTTGKFHLIANEGTTAVKYYNSTTTDPTQAWNTPSAMETNTLAAASAGGADLDPTTDGLYASWGISAAPYDLHLGRVENYTLASSGATFSLIAPDLSGNLQLSAGNSQLHNTAMASTSTGLPAIAYVDYSVGSAANAKLKYALRSAGGSQGTWEPTLVPGTINPEYPSLGFDDEDHPWISFFDAGVNKHFLVTNSHSDGSGSWSTYQFPAVPAGAPLALPATDYTAIAMMNVSGTLTPLMIVIDTNASSKGVKAASFNPNTRNWSSVVIVDGLTAGALGASFLAADADKNGNVVIAYQDLSATRVKYATTNGGAVWSTPVAVSLLNQGPGVSIRINPANDQPAISYFDQTNNLVIYNSCSGTITSCATGGWNPQPVEGAAGVSGLSAASGQLIQASLDFTSSGVAYLLYPRGQANDGNLIMSNNSEGGFLPTVISDGTNGNLTGSPALNFAVAGWSLSSTHNASGGVTTSFVGPGDWLYAASCGD